MKAEGLKKVRFCCKQPARNTVTMQQQCSCIIKDILPHFYHLNNVYRSSSGHMVYLRYKNQQVHIVLGNKHCLFLESFETYKYTLWTK